MLENTVVLHVTRKLAEKLLGTKFNVELNVFRLYVCRFRYQAEYPRLGLLKQHPNQRLIVLQ